MRRRQTIAEIGKSGLDAEPTRSGGKTVPWSITIAVERCALSRFAFSTEKWVERQARSRSSIMKRRTGPTYPDVWTVVARIPRGSVATYGQIADLLGIPGRARFVGYALHALPPGTPVPWHRVVNALGKTSLAGESGRTQIALLAKEGVAVSPAGINLRRSRWNPAASRRIRRQAAHTRTSRGGAVRRVRRRA